MIGVVGTMKLFRFMLVSLFITFLFTSSSWNTQAQNQSNLLPTTVTNVNATTNITLNLTLPSGFILSGNITGTGGVPLLGGTVTAQSSNAAYSGPITPQGLGGTYSIVLPAGTYSLSVTRLVLDFMTGDTYFIEQNLGIMVTINGNTTRNLVLPPLPPTFAVSGNVTGSSAFPPRGGINFTSSDGRIQAVTELDGSYNLALPAASYFVSISPNVSQPGGIEQGLFIAMGTVTVSGPQTFNFTLPNGVNLSGVVRRANGSPVPGAVVSATTNVNNPLQATSATSTVPEQTTTGQYRMTIPAGTYNVGAITDIDLGQGQEGSLIFPFPFQSLTVAGNQTRDFTVPNTPAVVVISGTVRTQQGQPVAGAVVGAFSTTITNTPNVAFGVSTETNSAGMYQLRVLSGTNYTVEAEPAAAPGGKKPAQKWLERLQSLSQQSF
ncbi:MAG: carboxypeptidase-like regulatory domain-containing protein [Acidobacteriota bacterium]|nr:carboxypeptidase-like regulatory domain-containing protein [Blastocatellia bacterium]MDW8239366.1 carboxypeptidase-like regulatory domain-containing protein [Acidobacteriota bacterium]